MTAKPRVLLLTPDYPPAHGGIQTVAHRVAQHLRRFDCQVLTIGIPGAQRFDRSQSLDVRRIAAPGGRRASLALLNLRAPFDARRYRPDIVLSLHIVTSPAARAIAALRRIPVVQYLHADEVRGRSGLASFGLRNADAVVAVSRHTRQLALEAGARPDRVHIILNGVDLPRVSATGRSADPTVLTVAALSFLYKGHDVMMQALPRVRARIPTVTWIIIGDGPLRTHLENLARAYGVSDSVRFLGSTPDAVRDSWFDRAHVFVMPSRLPAGGKGGEGFGIAYLEASAHGLPVVGGNVGGAPDAVIHGKTGVLVDPTDPVAVADAVADLFDDRDRAGMLGRNGRAHAASLAWPGVVERLEELMLQVIRDFR